MFDPSIFSLVTSSCFQFLPLLALDQRFAYPLALTMQNCNHQLFIFPFLLLGAAASPKMGTTASSGTPTALPLNVLGHPLTLNRPTCLLHRENRSHLMGTPLAPCHLTYTLTHTMCPSSKSNHSKSLQMGSESHPLPLPRSSYTSVIPSLFSTSPIITKHILTVCVLLCHPLSLIFASPSR